MLLTVYFDGQFWYAVVESHDLDGYRVVRRCFGPEPSDGQVKSFVEKNLLVELDRAIPLDVPPDPPKKMNPKRLQRKVSEELSQTGLSTKAQEALSRSRELKKEISGKKKKLLKKEEKEDRRRQHVAKKKKRRRGR